MNPADTLTPTELWSSVAALAAAVPLAIVLLNRRVLRIQVWRATVTPLASIIGSGFLIIAPLLAETYGRHAWLAMLGLCALGYLFGGAIRYTMREKEALATAGRTPRFVLPIERLSSILIAFAYTISVAYYLNLFGAFAIGLSPLDVERFGRWVSSAVLVFIGVYGWQHGFGGIERLEEMSVGLKLSMIGGLLAALTVALAMADPTLHTTPTSVHTPNHWAALFMGLGMIVTVQGFETSRYLGASYPVAMRIRTMRYAQYLSTAIYLVYVGLIITVFGATGIPHKETAIIDMTREVAPILPLMLVAAALAAQFSAAAADASGCSGLLGELSRGRISLHHVYPLLAAAGLYITWTSNVFQIIAYASRAFAAYYAIESLLALLLAWRARHLIRATMFAIATCIAVVAVLFAQPV